MFWGRKIRQSRQRTDRLEVQTDVKAKKVADSSERLTSASTRAERAALAILARDDEFLRMAARRS